MSNTITITGNVATEPEHKRTSAGVAITTFRVASGLRRFDRASGAWVDAGRNFYTVSAFRSLADHAFQSLRKGDRVLLTGRLRIREWESGDRRGTAVEIDADAIGHDLLWGTTTFVKDSPAGGERSGAATGADADADAWAAPGVAASQGEEWPAPDPAAAEPAELVGAEQPF
jgi:single-strand DNA-binding protein